MNTLYKILVDGKSCQHPDWWKRVELFVDKEIPAVSWCKPDGNPDPGWKLFTADSLNAAWDAARDAAWDAASDAAWDAASDAALRARVFVVSDLDFPNKAKHQAHVDARWRVWQKGYCLLCDVNGVLYVYCKK